MSTRETAQLAGLRTSKLIATEPWPCPETCRERGGDLLWKGSRTINAELSRTEDLALRFATLCSADTPAIVRFARRFGPLYLCEHRLPMTHIPEHAYRYMLDELPLDVQADLGAVPDIADVGDFDRQYPMSPPASSFAGTHLTGDSHSVKLPRRAWVEAVDDWRFWSMGADLLIRFMASCQLNSSPPLEEWDELEGWLDAFPREFNYGLVSERVDGSVDRRPPGLSLAQSITAAVLDAWIQWGNVRLSRQWGESALGLEIRAETLFGAITADLIRLSLTDDVEFCTYCRQPFTPAVRRTRRGTYPYCQQDECRKAISRNSKRRKRNSEFTQK
jgi:hypothetical protein